METFQPLINLIVLMSALSVAAERLANVLKLGNPDLRDSSKKRSRAEEKERERRIGIATLGVSVLLAMVVKADFFAILSHLEAPWDTLGWVRPSGTGWVRSPATGSLPQFLYAAGGTMLTGIAMGFGSKFWHDVLDIVYRSRDTVRNRRAADRREA